MIVVQSLAMLLDSLDPMRQYDQERPQGEAHVDLTVQCGWLLLRVEPSVQTCCHSAGMRHRQERVIGGGREYFWKNLLLVQKLPYQSSLVRRDWGEFSRQTHP